MSTTANTDTYLIQTILGNALPAFRETCLMPKLVFNGDEDPNIARQRGDTVQFDVYPTSTPAAITPGEADVAPKTTAATRKTISLSNWYQDNFHLSNADRDQYHDVPGFISENAKQKIRSLANKVNDTILAAATGAVHNMVGTPATTPFGSGRLDQDCIDAIKLLNENQCPKNERYGVLDWDAWAAAAGLDAFKLANERGGPTSQMTGELGRAFGAEWYGEDAIAQLTNGTLTNGSGHLAKINSSSVAVGDTSVAMDESTLSGTIAKGEVFTVAGDTQMYTVTALATAAANAIAAVSFYPAAKVAWDNDAVVTFKGAASAVWDQNLLFNKNAFALVSRPLEDGMSNSAYVIDEVTGIAIRGMIKEQWYQTAFYFDILWGVGCIRPELACYIAG